MGKPNLLIVDDERDILDTLEAELEDSYVVVTATSGEEALGILKSDPGKFNVILCDELMPGMKGHEVLEKVSQRYNHIGRVLISGNIDVQGLSEAINRGNISGFVVKPWKPEQLNEVLAKACQAGVRGIIVKKPETGLEIYNREGPLIEKSNIINKENALPFSVIQFALKDFQCIKYTRVSDIPSNTKWIMVTGDNGDGKTSLLQGIAIGLWGSEDASHLLKTSPRETCQINVEYQKPKDGDSKIPIFKYFGLQWDAFPPPGVLLTYGPSRLSIMTVDEQWDNPVFSLFHQEGYLRNIEIWLKNWKLDINDHKDEAKGKLAEKRLKNVTQLLVQLMPNVTEIKFSGHEIIYEEKGQDVPVQHLSAGHKSILAMIGDMVIRLFEQHPNTADPKDISGIVIIDELGCHLHPRSQILLPRLLSDIFPKIQFIASSHSPLPFIGAPEETVYLKVIRNEEDGTKVEKLDVDVKRLLPNALLTSPLFDLEYIANLNNNGDISKVSTAESYDEFMSLEDLEKRINMLAQGPSLFPPGSFEEFNGKQ